MKVNVNELLNSARQKLKEHNIDTLEARLLLAFVLDIDICKLVLVKECEKQVSYKFVQLIEQRIQGIPYAYLVGKQEFMKLPFVVTQDVLIPRADTEILVEHAINLSSNFDKQKINILDMCTGSGCIGISLKKYIENGKVVAVDISDKALGVAKENAFLNNADVEFIQSDLFCNIPNRKFDLIVSNPPYIKTSEIPNLQNEVKNEPIIALDGGESGLDIYTRIINSAKDYLSKQGYLILEIGFDQADEIKKLLQARGYIGIKVIKDLSNNDRVVVARI